VKSPDSAWQFRWLADFGADLCYSFRSFVRSPGFTATAVLSLALGIGANSAVFTALDGVLWRQLPVADPASLVQLSVLRRGTVGNLDPPAELVRQVRESGLFSNVITATPDGLSFSYDDRAERIIGEAVSSNFFTALGVEPILGQAFTPAVQHGGWAAEAVISYSFWTHRFGGDPAIIGRTIRLNTYPFVIVGVLPPSFFGLTRGTDYEVRIPVLPEGREIREIGLISGSPGWGITTVARLRPGTTAVQAEAAAAPQFQEFLHVTPNPRYRNATNVQLVLNPAGRGARVHTSLLRLYQPLYVVSGLVAIVLLIACVNVANVLLARASAREREFAIRGSIGAGRFRLIRQMLAESVLLSLTGGAIGVAVAYWSTGLLFRFLPQGHTSIVLNLQPNGRAVLFTFGLSILTGALFGLAPATRLARRDLAATIKSDSSAAVGDLRSIAFRKVLISSQVAFSLVLLIAAGMFVRVLSELRPVAYQANPKSILLFTLKPQPEIYTRERSRLLAAELIRRTSQIPGVEAAGLAENGPLGSRSGSVQLQVPGGTPVETYADWVSPGFLDTIGVARVGGRDFSAADQPGTTLVAIVNQALARQMFPNQTRSVGRWCCRLRERARRGHSRSSGWLRTRSTTTFGNQSFQWFGLRRTHRTCRRCMSAAGRRRREILSPQCVRSSTGSTRDSPCLM
jgi:predicted permease